MRGDIGRCAVFLLCVGAVLGVPYLFPPHSGISVSTMAGFSNRAAEVLLLVLGLGFALWTRGWGLRLQEATGEVRGRSWWIVPAVAVCLAIAASLYLWYWASNMGPYDEAIYFLDRFSNQIAGGRVYRDFLFDYGPLMYWPSWWLAKLLRIPVGHAYYLFCLLEWAAGVLLLWRVISALRARAVDRAIVFTALTLAWFASITDQGAQYTPLRFVLASACALWVHRLWELRAEPVKTARSMVPAMVAAAGSFAGLLLYSPEQGIGFAVATVLFFMVSVRRSYVALPLVAFLVWCGAVFAVAARMGWMGVLFTFAGGSFNLPLLPGYETVFLVAMLVAAACVVVCAFYEGESTRPELYLIALALAAVPAAFGRADPGHIFINSLPALLVVTLALLRLPRRRMPVVVAWGVYVCLAALSHTRQQVNVLMHSAPRLEKMPSAAELPPAGVGLRAPIRYFSYLDGQFGPKVITGRYYSFDLAFPGLAEEKIAELQQHPRDLIVVPVEYRSACEGLSPETLQRSLRGDVSNLFVPRVRPVPNVKQPLCDYISSHYVGSPYRVPREEYRVMQPRAFRVSPLTGSAAAWLQQSAPQPM
ncbi:hypothetical protein [Terriglobus aquaticus]|uniref:Uncharacterized protein n=1 Tax=Terriglobus aquaticus TaxID=940139 RepID=A0ABW9KMB6_9BACT|nr:hypothetical protein [Terriglobus aquaticus]